MRLTASARHPALFVCLCNQPWPYRPNTPPAFTISPAPTKHVPHASSTFGQAVTLSLFRTSFNRHGAREPCSERYRRYIAPIIPYSALGPPGYPSDAGQSALFHLCQRVWTCQQVKRATVQHRNQSTTIQQEHSQFHPRCGRHVR